MNETNAFFEDPDATHSKIPAEGPLLGIDPGTKRVGVASVRAFDIVHPICCLDAEPRAQLLARIKALAEDRDCVGIVVGLPINMDGTEGPSAKFARAMADEIEAHCRLPVALCDERLTSYSAERALGPLGLTRKKKKLRVDAVAAATILETFLGQRAARQGGADRGAGHEEDP